MSNSKKNEILEIPIRGELFSSERLDQYAIYLAKNLQISKDKNGINLLNRVDENYNIFVNNYKNLTSDLQKNLEIPPAGQWIVDNHFVIEDQIREIRKNLPKKFYAELPKIQNGELMGYPRVYSIALTLIAHLDSHLEMPPIESFVKSFQSITPLTIGEIWALPITLRIALIENLRRLIVQVKHGHDIKIKTSELAEKIITNQISLKNFSELFQCLLNESYMSDHVCISHLSKQLRDQFSEDLPIQEMINKYLASKNQSIEEIINKDHLQQAITQVTIGNIVGSMRLLSSVDWRDFFENVSLSESILANDPAGTYKKMNFATRDKYRHIIEKIAKNTNSNEITIAQETVKMARDYLDKNENENENKYEEEKSHIGHYLIGEGFEQLKKHFSYQRTIRERFQHLVLKNPSKYYFFTFIILQLISTVGLFLFYKTILPNKYLILAMIIATIPISDCVINILNFIITTTLPPRVLPKLELKNEIPDIAKSFIVVPTIFNNTASVYKIIETLEVHYLSNIDSNLYFAILSDFSDSTSETNHNDQEILKLAGKLIAELNNRYCNMNSQFFVFHRPSPLE